jgi:hypothetical protein
MKTKRFPNSLTVQGTLNLLASAKGKRATFRLVANTGRPMDVAGYYHPIVIDLSGAAFEKPTTPVIADHDTSKRIGHTTRQTIGEGRIEAEGVVSSSSPEARSFVADAKNGYPFQVSVGAQILESAFVGENESATVNGRTLKGPLVIAKRSLIKEISITVLGADSATSVAVSATANHKGKPMTKRKMPSATEQEEERIDQIKAIFARYQNVAEVEYKGKTLPASAFQRIAIRNALDPRDVHLALLQADIPKPVRAMNGPFLGRSPDLLQAILLTRMGLEKVAERTLGPHALESIGPRRDASLVDLCRMSLEMEGIPIPTGKDAMIRAAFSTASLPEALSGSIDKIVGVAFEEAGQTWASFCAVRPLASFREYKTISVHNGLPLQEMSPDGVFPSGTLYENTGSLRLATFGKKISLSRQAVLNDNLGFLEDLGRSFGVQAARTLNDLVWETIMANGGSFFHADHANLLTGGSSALSITSLASAVQSMRKQRDEEHNDLDIRPAVLAVPPELEVTARAILESLELARDTSAGDSLPIANPLRNLNLRLEVEPRLSNTSKWGTASTTRWFLFGPPSTAPVYVANLEGRMGPSVEFFGLDHDINVLAVAWRVWADYGCALGEYRAAVRADGV